jgi:hypothetical protein
MRQLILVLSFLAALPANATSIVLSVDTTGVSNASVSGTPAMKPIDMEGTADTNQLSLSLAITPGTTTAVVVKCYESENNSKWAQISLCDAVAPTSDCQPDARNFTLANYTTMPTGQKVIASRWSVKQRYARCSVYGAGTGKVSISGSRSWQ